MDPRLPGWGSEQPSRCDQLRGRQDADALRGRLLQAPPSRVRERRKRAVRMRCATRAAFEACPGM